MPHAVINTKGIISVYEFKPDRSEACCVCKHDIIELPESIFSIKFIERLRRAKSPIDLEEFKNKKHENFNHKVEIIH